MFISSPAATQTSSDAPHKMIPAGMGLRFSLVTALFFLWGMPNNLNDVLIRQFMTSFAISRFEAGLVQSAFYLGYFVLATPAALLMRRYGYKFGFLAGLILFGAGSFLFWPAAVVGNYWFFLGALFVIASGLSFLETAANPFVAQMGDPASAARRLNFAQAFNPIGAISGVLIGTVFIVGFCANGALNNLSAVAANLYPTNIRATGIGWGLGFGRVGSIAGPMIGSWLLLAKVELAHLFSIIALPSLFAAVAMFVLNLRTSSTSTMASAGVEAVTADT